MAEKANPLTRPEIQFWLTIILLVASIAATWGAWNVRITAQETAQEMANAQLGADILALERRVDGTLAQMNPVLLDIQERIVRIETRMEFLISKEE